MNKPKLEHEVCKAVNEKLHFGDPISDKELKLAIPIYQEVVDLFETMHDRKFFLFLNYLREDLNSLKGFAEARKIKV